MIIFNRKHKGENKLSSISLNTGIYKTAPASGVFRGAYADDIISKGDKALNENKYKEALKYYQKANNINPDEIKVYKKLAKAQYGLKKYEEAEKNYKIYLEENPDDFDIIIELGRTQKQRGYYKNALNTFKRAYELDKQNDLAKRSILETENYILSVYSPEKAAREKEQYASKNLARAVKMTSDFMTSKYMKEIGDIKIQFGKTESMGGTENIAQYENYKNSITVSNSYIYAAPQLIAAYLSHESVHAHDHDPYTSIREEQDAYETAAKFWIKNASGIKDPEMDYAAGLYRRSPEVLSARVAEIYKLRDPDIPKTSPNHPIENSFFKRSKNTAAAASGTIRTYDVIA